MRTRHFRASARSDAHCGWRAGAPACSRSAGLHPDKEFVYNNIDISKEAIIVKPLISESPLVIENDISSPRLEKILIDIMCDDDMDYLHGSEWLYIFNNALNSYNINRATLLRYSARRNAKERIKEILETITNYD